ncbi:TldD/PmbA family protein [Prochlorococcus marinus]|uniref:TldD/PmbA family protein n=1 Tax=Prochlorococcus marinus TaxID=1219 RepID=UPI0021C3EC40|nr:TldD/PmbA family protein [Prochlorococcus marinus]
MTNSLLTKQSENLLFHTFDETLKPQIEDLLSLGKSAGADIVEIFLEKSDNISLLAEQDAISSVSPSFGIGAGIRVFLGKKDGFVSTNDLSKAGLLFALTQALGMLGLEIGSQNKNNFEGLKNLKDFGIDKNTWLNDSPDLNESTIKLLESTKLLASKNKNLQVRRASYSRNWQEVIVAATDGVFARDIRLHQTVGINVIAIKDKHRSTSARRYGSSGNPNDLRNWDIDKSSCDLNESAQKMLHAEYVEAGQMPVVLANKFGGVIFHEACGHLLETTQLERGTSPFHDKVNKQIAHKAVSAVDEGLSNYAFGSISMDDEGMEPQNTLLIENGILKKFLSDRAGSLRTGHPRTGSGRRQNFSFAAASRMRNTYIKKGNYSPEKLIESIENGLYCKSMGGGSVGPTGQFNFSVEEGYLIKKGKLDKPVKGATLIGEAKEILPRISMCANDLDLAAGFCGSVSGSVNVTVGQPHIKVDSITVGGR